MSIYQTYLIPLDTTGSSDFTVELITVLSFSPGNYDQQAIKTLVTNNPLWTALNLGGCDAWIVPFKGWRDTLPRQPKISSSPGVQTISLKLLPGQPDSNTMEKRTLDYFGITATVGNPSQTTTHDARQSAAFIDLNDGLRSLHQSTNNLRSAASTRFASQINFGAGIGGVSLPFLRWMDSASRSSILNQVYPPSTDAPPTTPHIDVQDIKSLQDAAGKIQKRAIPSQRDGSNGLFASGQTAPLSPDDLNAAVHAALRDQYLASYLGFRTTWACRGLNLAVGAYLIQLGDLSFPLDPSNRPPVAFLFGTHTHPAGFYDVTQPGVEPFTSTTGLFVQLNKMGKPSYSTACIDVEPQLTRDIVLQGTNSLAAPANSPTAGRDLHENPFLLKQQRAGSSESTTSGVVFNAPVAHLLPPSPLVEGGSRDAGRQVWPCLFLEDLWIGYRLEIKRRGDSKFLSVHNEKKYYTLTSGTVAPDGGAAAAVWVEDFIDREQQDAGPDKPPSTSLYTYNGFTKQQMENYRIVMNLPTADHSPAVHSFHSTVTDFKASEPLIFGREYDYRLRTVFLGGTGAQPCLGPDGVSSDCVQGFSFYRSHAFKPGELLLRKDSTAPQNLDGGTLYLSVYHVEHSVFLMPSPIDLDTARYEGLLFGDASELSNPDLVNRDIVTDLGKLGRKANFTNTNYFLEPHVSCVFVRISAVSGDMRDEARTVEGPGGTILHVRPHVRLAPIELQFGATGDWKHFRPIELNFRAMAQGTTDVTTRVDGQKLTVYVPPAAELHISIIPSVTSEDVTRTAAFAPTTWQYGVSSPQLGDSPLTLPPAAIAETTLRVIYAVEKPLLTPQMRAMVAAPGNIEQFPQVVLGIRSTTNTMATPQVRVDIDASSSKELYLDATWNDIGGSFVAPTLALQPGHSRSQAKSIIFRPVEPYNPTAAALDHYLGTRLQPNIFPLSLEEQFHHQECEDTVIAVNSATTSHAENTARPLCAIDFGDARRKWGNVQAVAISRFAAHFDEKNSNFEQRSESLALDVPSAVLLVAPQIQSIRHLKSIETVSDVTGVQRRSRYALRIYLAVSPFASGVGQRVAVGCAAGAFAAVDSTTHELVNYASLWGEDPVGRPRLEVSQRFPHAFDFGSPYADAAAAGLDERYYPVYAVAGNNPVIYRDNLLVGATATKLGHYISVASYALTFDPAQNLWYFDMLTTTGFRGWLRLAIFAHQPHAANGCELSQTATRLYASALGEDFITWRRWLGRIYVSVGPIDNNPDLTYSLDEVTYRSGVSNRLNVNDTQLAVQLSKIQVGHQCYFEGNVSAEGRWNWVKRYFGAIVDSGEITTV